MLQVFNENGSLVLDASDRLSRILGRTSYTFSSNTSINSNGYIITFSNIFTGNGTPFTFLMNTYEVGLNYNRNPLTGEINFPFILRYTYSDTTLTVTVIPQPGLKSETIKSGTTLLFLYGEY